QGPGPEAQGVRAEDGRKNARRDRPGAGRGAAHAPQRSRDPGDRASRVSQGGRRNRADRGGRELPPAARDDRGPGHCRDLGGEDQHPGHGPVRRVRRREGNHLEGRDPRHREAAGGLQVDLRAVEPDAYGAALLYFTGSKAHNIDLRKIAQEKSYKLNEYGLIKGTRRAAGKTEEEVYAKLGLDWIPPELREARGEIALAREHRLPHLVEVMDIRGDLQMHTSATDGKGTIEDMAHAARALGYQYIAITDHSKRVTMALGLDTKRLREQWKAIDAWNAASRGFTVLKSIELDILETGKLD